MAKLLNRGFADFYVRHDFTGRRLIAYSFVVGLAGKIFENTGFARRMK